MTLKEKALVATETGKAIALYNQAYELFYGATLRLLGEEFEENSIPVQPPIATRNGFHVAHWLSRQGIAVVPSTESKTPFEKGGFKNATTNLQTIQHWHKKYPNCLWGIKPGKDYSRIIVIDIDCHAGKSNGLDTLKQLQAEHGTLPKTVMLRTPSGGLHLWFIHPRWLNGGEIRSRTSLFPGIDLLGDGDARCAIIAPGETSKGRYEWVEGHTPWEFGVQDIPELPDWILKAAVSAVWRGAAGKKINSKTSLSLPFQERGGANTEGGITRMKKILNPCYILNPRYTPAGGKEKKGKEILLEAQRDFGLVADILSKLPNGCARAVTKPGEAFFNPIPGYDEGGTSKSASLLQKTPEDFVHLYSHTTKANFTIPEVYAAAVTGKSEKLKRARQAVWWIRALYETGHIELPELKTYPLPKGHTESDRKVYGGIVLLLRCRKLHSGDDFTPFSWRFGMSWCGIGCLNTVGKVLKRLLQWGYIYNDRTVQVPNSNIKHWFKLRVPYQENRKAILQKLRR